MSSALIKGALLCAGMAATMISGGSNSYAGTAAKEAGELASIDGLVSLRSARSGSDAMSALLAALDSNKAITALPLINHQANATGVDKALRPTSVQLFGNPVLGTPLMQVNPLVGLDLPQKILAWENEEGDTQIAYNSVDYLRQRHAINGSDAADKALQTISGALSALSFNASGNTKNNDNDTDSMPSVNVSVGEGVITVTSVQDMETTYAALVASIQNAGPLRLMGELDHAANAQRVGMVLNPTRLIIFGNPNVGTLLMQSEQTIGIDLPQKMLVFEDENGIVTIAYNDPAYLAARHHISGQNDRLAAIQAALAGLANQAAGITAGQ